MTFQVFHSLKSVLHKRGLSTAVGDEGGFAPALKGAEDALSVIMEAVERAEYEIGKDISIALDCAASEFFDNGYYDYTRFEGSVGRKITSDEQIDYLEMLVSRYPIDSIEDGMSENDWDGWKHLTDTIGKVAAVVN